MENKLFEADETKHKYNIVIECYENCAIVKVQNIGEQKNMTYHELIGIMETQKQHIIWTQRESNMANSKLKIKSKTAKKNGS